MSDETKPERNCGNCACLWRPPESAKDANVYCRRNIAQAQMIRVEVPRVIRGVAQIKDGKPVMEMGQQMALLYPPTVVESVCFDGWRPMGTEPGAKYWDSGTFMEQIANGYKRLWSDIQTQALADLDAQLAVGKDGKTN